MSNGSSNQPIEQLLLKQGAISEDQLRIALLEQKKSRRQLGKLLVELGFISEAIWRDAHSVTLGQQSVDLSQASINPTALGIVPRDIAVRFMLLPLDYDVTIPALAIAAADPDDIIAQDYLRDLVSPGLSLDIFLAGEAEISRAIDKYYGYELSINGILHEMESEEAVLPGADTLQDEYS